MSIKQSLSNLTFEKVSFIILTVCVGLLSFFIIPTQSLMGISKISLIVVGIILSGGLFLLHSLFSGKILFPKNKILLSLSLVFLVSIVSSLFSANVNNSLVGFFENDTVIFLGLMILLVYLVSVLFIPRKRSAILFISILIGSIILGVLQIISIFFNNLVPSNIFGSVNDLAIFFGLILTLTTLSLEFIEVKKFLKTVILSALVLSLIFLFATNVTMVWYTVGIFALIVFVYSFSTRISSKAAYKIPVLPLIVILVSVLSVLFSGSSIYSITASIPGLSLIDKMNISSSEARPSLVATMTIGKDAVFDKNFFGVSPNKFREAWNLYRSESVNLTQFWNIDFVSGFSFISSSFVTLGPSGFLLWIATFVFYLFYGYKIVFKKTEDSSHKISSIVSFMGGLYLWIFLFIYPPGPIIMTMCFLFVGLFIASMIYEKISKVKTISIIEDPRIAFAGVSGLVVSLIVLIIVFYISSITLASAIYGNLASLSYRNGQVDKTEQYINRAISLKEDDGYYRFYTAFYLSRINTVLANSSSNNTDIQKDIETMIQNTLQIASRAVAIDKNDYLNWINLGKVYQAITVPNNTNAYEQAVLAYKKVTELNPHDPSIYLLLSQLEISFGEVDKAKKHIENALNKKYDYTDAYLALSRVLVGEGSLKEAIVYAESATLTAPYDPNTFLQLGILRYNNKDFEGAARAFERSLVLNPLYANAQYFLGLTYQKLNRVADSVILFDILYKNNPDNADVLNILNNLKANRDPFYSNNSDKDN